MNLITMQSLGRTIDAFLINKCVWMQLVLTSCTLLILTSCQPTLIKITTIETPAKENSCCSNIHKTNNGNIHISWIEDKADSISILQVSQLESAGFLVTNQVAQGADWFVNWADFPELASFIGTDRQMINWLDKSTGGTYDYDIKFAISDKENQWDEHGVLHNDSIAAEHGFVSIAQDEQSLLAVWLDGRNMKSDIGDHGHGPMTLRSAKIDKNGKISDRQQIDDIVCECCQTDLVKFGSEHVVVYRNKDDNGFRDCYYSMLREGTWTKPKPIFNDNWAIDGCPVNGPALASFEDQLAAIWYTGVDDESKIQVAFYDTSAERFDAPITISQGNTLGRIDAKFVSANQLIISHIDQTDDAAVIRMTTVEDRSKTDQFDIIETSTSRSSGFPRIVIKDNTVIMSYTEVKNDQTQVKTLQISI